MNSLLLTVKLYDKMISHESIIKDTTIILS